MQYEVIYEEKYMQPGFVIYRNDFKQFLKIIPNGGKGSDTVTFLVSNEEADNMKQKFRVFSFQFEKNSVLYAVFHQLKERLDTQTNYSIQPITEGNNQLSIDEMPDGLHVHFVKDLAHSNNLYSSAMKLTLGGAPIRQFVLSLDSLQMVEDHGHVLQKMINLKTRK